VAITGAIFVVLAIVFGLWLWQDRPDLAELDWPVADVASDSGGGVTVTWLGVTSLVFDDGETQILIDGFFSRFGIYDYLFSRIGSDIENVDYVMAKYRINRLAAIIPVHSRFDHAMDVGIIANRSTAVVLGSESTANIVRAENLPVNQYQILASGESREFGAFTVTLLTSRSVPAAYGGKAPFAGTIGVPLHQPARINAWKEGHTYSIVLSHPRGTTLIQGSAGYLTGNLKNISADVVMLSVGGLSGLGKQYTRRYWKETVTTTGAKRVYPIHFDDFSKPFGTIELFPGIVDDVVKTSNWINEATRSSDMPTVIRRLPFGQPVALY